jgi:hypothetical protein
VVSPACAVRRSSARRSATPISSPSTTCSTPTTTIWSRRCPSWLASPRGWTRSTSAGWSTATSSRPISCLDGRAGGPSAGGNRARGHRPAPNRAGGDAALGRRATPDPRIRRALAPAIACRSGRGRAAGPRHCCGGDGRGAELRGLPEPSPAARGGVDGTQAPRVRRLRRARRLRRPATRCLRSRASTPWPPPIATPPRGTRRRINAEPARRLPVVPVRPGGRSLDHVHLG